MPKFQSYHGCFGWNAGDNLQAFDSPSNAWTQVTNRKCKGDKNISKLLGYWNIVQDTKWIRNLEVTPETFAYLRTPAPLPGHSNQLCGARTHPGHVRFVPRFKNPTLDLSLQKVEKLIVEVTANDKQLEEGKAEQAQTISYL
jgi:hypothetical protein